MILREKYRSEQHCVVQIEMGLVTDSVVQYRCTGRKRSGFEVLSRMVYDEPKVDAAAPGFGEISTKQTILELAPSLYFIVHCKECS